MNPLAAAVIGISSVAGALSDKDPLIQHIHAQVMQTIENSDSVPGLKSEEFASLKAGIAERWNELVKNGVLEVTARDADARPYFVALQGIIEHVLSHELNKKVTSLTGVIHTPAPATPLCTEGNVSEELVDPSVAEDPRRLFTVKLRPTIIRDYLFQGGDLYIAYPKEGLLKRNEAQQKVYTQELENYRTHLFDRPMECASIENDLVGAFYLFKGEGEKVFAFAIKMTQANNPQELGSFGLWFDEVKNAKTPAQGRISSVMEFISQHSTQPISLPL